MKIIDVVVNGPARSGKDTVIETIERLHPEVKVRNLSSIDPFRDLPRLFGWNGEKDLNYRMCLSLLKKASSYIDDFPTRDLMRRRFSLLSPSNGIIIFFYNIREPEEIRKLAHNLSFKGKSFVTLLVRKESMETPESEKDVFNFDYDYIIYNTGTLEEFEDKIESFYQELSEISD